MLSKKTRISVTLKSSVAALLGNLAKQEGKSVSGLAAELIHETLERREDLPLSSIAASRDKPNTKRMKHEDIW